MGAFLVFAFFCVSTLYYVVWRVAVVNWTFWWVGVPLLLAETFSIVNTLGLLYTAWPYPEPLIQASLDPSRLPVYVLIPTVNEGVEVVEPTLHGVLAARARYLEAHPDASITVVVCNDGQVGGYPHWQEIEALADQMGVFCVTRTVPGGAKAGNIEHARQTVGGGGPALLALFDADMVAEPEFFLKTLPPFGDPTVGWVQTGQYYRNKGSIMARWAHDQQLLFYRLICVGKAAVNGAFICGTNVVIRAAALDTIGGLPQNTVTEDLAASILLHPKWRSIYLPDVLALGLGPEDLGAYFSQQRRWATGTFGVLFRHWRVMLLPWHRGLTGPQRLQYLLCCAHFFSGFRDLICLLVPLAYLWLGVAAFRAFGLAAFFQHFLPYWAWSLFAFWYVTRGKADFRVILHGSILGFGSFPVFLSSFAGALFGKRLRFVVTAKRRSGASDAGHFLPHVVVLLLCLGGIGHYALSGHRNWLGLAGVLWLLYMVVLSAGMLWLGLAENPETEQRIVRAAGRLRPALLGTVLVLGLAGAWGLSRHVPRPARPEARQPSAVVRAHSLSPHRRPAVVNRTPKRVSPAVTAERSQQHLSRHLD